MWYVISNAGGAFTVFVPAGTDPGADGTVVSGPYPSQAAAQAGMAGKSTGALSQGGAASSSEPWYVYITNFTAPAGTNWVAGVRQFPGAAAYTAALGYSPTTYFAHLGQTDAGYATQAAAQSAADSFNGAGPPAAGGIPGGPGAVTLPGIPDPLSSVQAEMAAIWGKLSDGKMWRSLGWLALGVALMITGVFLWLPKGDMPIPIPV